ncbi:hypothetical protein D9758_005953 [Tetrapyrgos nigripes]|uniref:DNA helicase n=1 Tax=Tetrapyrgos nigripes TaxID=182062 RepID=A0A8H5G316_9AGAR|nr:hypothetical protein D9758_005953 [Tetrapyrgos nigripes]
MSSRRTRTGSTTTHVNQGESEKHDGGGSSESLGGKTEAVSSKQMNKRKEMTLVKKQSDLESVYQEHDTLVREMFHMEHFRSMLGYDPEEAKKDDSAVFLNYRAMSYDLLDKTASMSTSVAGPSRRTRGAQSERLQLINPSLSAPLPSSSPIKPSAKEKRKWKDNSTVWDILADAKTKNKGKEKEDISTECSTTHSSGDANVESISVGLQAGRAKRRRPNDRDSFAISRRASETSFSSYSGIRSTPPAPPIILSPRKKRRKTHDGHSKPSNNIHDPGGPPDKRPAAPPQNDRASRRNTSRSVISISDSTSNRKPVTPSSSSNIRRIKLIVRRPPPLYSSPRQKPPPFQYNGSLTNFLESYNSLEDQEADEVLQTEILTKASLLEKASRLRKEGRFFPDAESLAAEVTAMSSPDKLLQRSTKDAWDHCIEDVLRYKRQSPSGPEIAAQIASKIQVYWEGQAARQEKWKAQEEKRLRALAKATIKMVTTEWKKAVFHLREQERLRREEEEKRRGHEHLDAILNRSGHILETQHIDLSKNDRSRSLSRASSTSTDWNHESDDDQSASSDDSDADDGQDDNERDGSTEDGMEAEDKEVPAFTSMMLPDSEAEAEAEASETADDFGPSLNSIEPTSPHSTPGPLFVESDTILDFPDSSSQLPNSPSSEIAELAVEEFLSVKDDSRSHSPSSFDVSTPNDNDNHVAVEHLEDASRNESSILDISAVAILGTGKPDVLTMDGESMAVDVDALEQPSDQLTVLALKPRFDGVDLAEGENGNDDRMALDGNSPSRADTPQPYDGTLLDSNVDGPTLDQEDSAEPADDSAEIPEYLKPYLVAPVQWDPNTKMSPPLLLRGVLRPYQFSGLEWLASLHSNNLNGILADEMGLGKTIQTISLLAHLACDRGIWGPHLIIVPTSVLLNWEMEFKKFLPGFKILSYHGNTKRRKELRQGWNDKLHFNVCITSYTLASRDAHIFKRKPWYYMILDEAHMIKNFKSQRWNILLMFRSFRRLLLTGTPLQNNLTELWALLQFLMSGTHFANLKEFGDWFSNPLEKAIEMGNILDDETMQRVSKLHTVLRPYLLRRLKRDVEKELPSKYEHLVLCPLSKRQRFLYDEFMSRAQTQDALQSGVYQKIANILMQLRKVCNHPDLFEVRPIVTSFAVQRSAVADFEIKELLIRRRLLYEDDHDKINLGVLGLSFVDRQQNSLLTALETRRLDATPQILAKSLADDPGPQPPKDTRTIKGFKEYSAWQKRAKAVAQWTHLGYLNSLRCGSVNTPIYSSETISCVRRLYEPIIPTSTLQNDSRTWALRYMDTVTKVHDAVLSYDERAASTSDLIEKFAFATPAVVALDLPKIVTVGKSEELEQSIRALPDAFGASLHHSAIKLQIAFPDPSLLQYDCGKLQMLSELLREKKLGGHRVLIFTQMTRILDILEIFLNFHGWLYLRLDGATKIEDRQYITELFNKDDRIFCFISSSRSGGVGINLTGADTVIFYDSDFNPQMDRQCEDRAHRIGQIRDVHIYRFVSKHTVEEAMLRKANQKRSLDDLVIQKGEFDWRTLLGASDNENEDNDSDGAEITSKTTFVGNGSSSGRALLTKALEEFEDAEDTNAARVAEQEEGDLVGADEADFGGGADEREKEKEKEKEKEDLSRRTSMVSMTNLGSTGDGEDDPMGEPGIAGDVMDMQDLAADYGEGELDEAEEGDEEEGGTVVEYMLAFIQSDAEFFENWSVR